MPSNAIFSSIQALCREYEEFLEPYAAVEIQCAETDEYFWFCMPEASGDQWLSPGYPKSKLNWVRSGLNCLCRSILSEVLGIPKHEVELGDMPTTDEEWDQELRELQAAIVLMDHDLMHNPLWAGHNA